MKTVRYFLWGVTLFLAGWALTIISAVVGTKLIKKPSITELMRDEGSPLYSGAGEL